MGPNPASGWVAALWRGALPLPVAFWHHAIAYGLIVNIAATLGSLTLIALDVPGWLAVVVHLAPLPYNVLFLVGVWRSAGRWRGDRRLADAARVIVTLWFAACVAL